MSALWFDLPEKRSQIALWFNLPERGCVRNKTAQPSDDIVAFEREREREKSEVAGSLDQPENRYVSSNPIAVPLECLEHKSSRSMANAQGPCLPK